MRIAWLNLRYTLPERLRVFSRGFEQLGYSPKVGLPGRYQAGDVFLTWNRMNVGDHAAKECEAARVPVIVTENAAWGNSFAGSDWYTLARGHHNESGRFPVGGFERWDRLGIELEPYRTEGETVILPQRGFGPRGHAMPRDWAETVRHLGRIRRHPGRLDKNDLRDDLAHCRKVVTWGSGAAVRAAMWGIEVESHMPNWIGAHEPNKASRLSMFRRLAWAQWTLDEIESGEAMARLLT